MMNVRIVWTALFIMGFSACQGGEQDQSPTPSPVSPAQSIEPGSMMHASAIH